MGAAGTQRDRARGPLPRRADGRHPAGQAAPAAGAGGRSPGAGGRPVSFYIAGAGGFGRESLDALRAMPPPACRPAVFLDDRVAAAEVDGVPVRRPEEAGAGEFVVAIADAAARQRL